VILILDGDGQLESQAVYRADPARWCAARTEHVLVSFVHQQLHRAAENLLDLVRSCFKLVQRPSGRFICRLRLRDGVCEPDFAVSVDEPVDLFLLDVYSFVASAAYTLFNNVRACLMF